MTDTRTSAVTAELRHYPRRAMTGEIEIVDRQFDFVRAVLAYDYRFTCNAQQWDEAARICTALEGQMISQGISVSAQGRQEPVAWLYETWCGEDHWSQRYSDAKPAGNQWERNI